MVDLHDDSINLRSLRRIDDHVREIQFCAGQVAIYYFNVEENNWQRKEIEGTLFFVRRAVHPEYAFVVINKLNTINLVQKITKDLETSLHEPYLMYKNTESEIFCIWFYDKANSAKLNQCVVDVINMQKKTPVTQSLNQLNNPLNLSMNTPANIQSDLLKKMLSVDSKVKENGDTGSKPVVPQVMSQPNVNEIAAKLATQRVNVHDLFKSNIVNAASEHSGISHKQKSETRTAYQYMKDELIKNNQPNLSNLMPTSPLAATTATAAELKEAHQNMPKVNLETLFQKKLMLDNVPSTSSPSNVPGLAATVAVEVSKVVKPTESDLYLTMEQLKQTLIWLLQTDADFLHVIHTTYVNRIKQRQPPHSDD